MPIARTVHTTEITRSFGGERGLIRRSKRARRRAERQINPFDEKPRYLRVYFGRRRQRPSEHSGRGSPASHGSASGPYLQGPLSSSSRSRTCRKPAKRPPTQSKTTATTPPERFLPPMPTTEEDKGRRVPRCRGRRRACRPRRRENEAGRSCGAAAAFGWDRSDAETGW